MVCSIKFSRATNAFQTKLAKDKKNGYSLKNIQTFMLFKVVGQIQVVGQISGMEVSVDSIIKKFCSRNYDEKLEIAKAEEPTPKLDILSSKFGCFKKCLMLVRVIIALNF